MTTQNAPKARTRKNPLNGTWDVQLQSITRNWHHTGQVSNRSLVDGWKATHRGVIVGYFNTKREAVQAVIDAEAEIGR